MLSPPPLWCVGGVDNEVPQLRATLSEPLDYTIINELLVTFPMSISIAQHKKRTPLAGTSCWATLTYSVATGSIPSLCCVKI